MATIRIWIGFIVGLLMPFSLSQPSWAQQVLKVGSIPIVHELPLHVAVAQGYFDQEGIKIVTETGAGGAALIPALLGGSIQLGHSAYTSVFVARDQGFDITIMFPYSQQPPGKDNSALLVLEESPIKQAKDFEGKTIAVNVIKSLVWLYTMEWLAKNGADANRVNFVEIPFPSMFPALRTKRVEAVFNTDPFIALEIERGGVRIVTRPYTELDPEIEISGVVATEKWAKGNQELVSRFARALKKGMDYTNSNRQKALEVLPKYTQLKLEWIPKLIMPQFRYPIKLERLQAHSDLALKWGIIKKKQNVADFIWPTTAR